jgi:acyl-CoA thioesterase II
VTKVIPADPIADLVEALSLEQIEANRFRAKSQWMPHGRVFGGQVLAQSLTAAINTTAADRHVHSLHSYFLRPGAIDSDIEFSVEILRDGNSFSARRVHAIQKGDPIFSMIASFQTESPGLSHSADFPKGVPDPESLKSASELLSGIDHPIAQYWSKARPFDLRHVGEPLYLKPAQEKAPNQMIWFRAISPLPQQQSMLTAALAYVSDYSILESILRRHGISWAHPGLSSASLDHAMWFHAQTNVNDWHLYVQNSPFAGGGRGLSQGLIFNQAGTHVATVAQEGMVRVPEVG